MQLNRNKSDLVTNSTEFDFHKSWGGAIELLTWKMATGMSLFDALCLTVKCRHPLDKVYGVMSLVYECERIAIDYSLEPEMLWKFVVVANVRDMSYGCKNLLRIRSRAWDVKHEAEP